MSPSKYRKWGGVGNGWDTPSHPRVVLETSWRQPFRFKRYPREGVPASISLTLNGMFSAGRNMGGGGAGPSARRYTGRYYHLEVGLLGARAKVRVHRPFWEETRAAYDTRVELWHRKTALVDAVTNEQGCPHDDKIMFPSRHDYLPNQVLQTADGEVTTYQPAGSTACFVLDCRKTIYFTAEQMDFLIPRKPDEAVQEAIASIKEGTNA